MPKLTDKQKDYALWVNIHGMITKIVVDDRDPGYTDELKLKIKDTMVKQIIERVKERYVVELR